MKFQTWHSTVKAAEQYLYVVPFKFPGLTPKHVYLSSGTICFSVICKINIGIFPVIDLGAKKKRGLSSETLHFARTKKAFEYFPRIHQCYIVKTSFFCFEKVCRRFLDNLSYQILLLKQRRNVCQRIPFIYGVWVRGSVQMVIFRLIFVRFLN